MAKKQDGLTLDLSKLNEINVTAKNIKNGEPKDGAYCPIALAIQDRLAGRWDDIEVGDRYPAVEASFPVLYAGKQVGLVTGRIQLELPKLADTFITAFDEDRPVKPTKFRARVKSVKIIN